MRYLQTAIVVAMFVTGSIAFSQEINFNDITGIWRSPDPGTSQIFQEGTDVKIIYVNKGFSHFFTGKYVNPKTVKGIQFRRNRSNECLTTMALTLHVQSPDQIAFEWMSLDSNCDLREGQKGSGTSKRDKKLEASAWY